MSQPDRAIEELTAQLKSARLALTLTVARAEQAETTASNALDEIRRLTAALGTLIQERDDAREERDAAIEDTRDYMQMALQLKEAEAALATERKKHDGTARHFNAAMDRLMVNNDELNRANAAQRAALARAEALLRECDDYLTGKVTHNRPVIEAGLRAALAAYLRDREGGKA